MPDNDNEKLTIGPSSFLFDSCLTMTHSKCTYEKRPRTNEID